MNSIYHYTNYREFLKDFVANAKTQRKGFSLRSFADKAQLASPAHLSLVIQGKRNLTLESIERFSKGLGLRSKEKDFFRALVQFNQETDPIQKTEFLKSLKKIKFATESKKLNFDEQTSLYDKWFLPLLFESVLLSDFCNDPKWVSQKLQKIISESDVIYGFEQLIKSKYLTPTSGGGFIQANSVIASLDDKESALIQAFHSHMGTLGVKALAAPVNEREFGAVTVALSQEQFLKLKQMVKNFINECNTEGSQPAAKDRVYQLNVQLFPITKK